MSPPPSKRVKISEVASGELASEPPDEEESASNHKQSTSSELSGEESSPGTEDQIFEAKRTKSKKTVKRKRRATAPSQFGATLQSLLSTDAPSTLPLSLKPSVTRKKNEEIEKTRAKALQVEKKKKEREDKGRMRDVIGGWGAEAERGLRKIAQRGVVQLFNAVQQSQAAAAADLEKAKASRGTGKPTLPAPAIGKRMKGGSAKHDNPGDATVGKDAFFDMLRSGTVVSKA